MGRAAAPTVVCAIGTVASFAEHLRALGLTFSLVFGLCLAGNAVLVLGEHRARMQRERSFQILIALRNYGPPASNGSGPPAC